MTIQCCVCQKLRLDGKWVVREVPHLPGESVSHTYCPRCVQKLTRELEIWHDRDATVSSIG